MCANNTLYSMAYAEMRIVMAKMVFNFDFELDQPEHDWWSSQGTYLLWEGEAASHDQAPPPRKNFDMGRERY